VIEIALLGHQIKSVIIVVVLEALRLRHLLAVEAPLPLHWSLVRPSDQRLEHHHQRDAECPL